MKPHNIELMSIIIPFSAETKQGRDEIWALIDELTGLAATEEA